MNCRCDAKKNIKKIVYEDSYDFAISLIDMYYDFKNSGNETFSIYVFGNLENIKKIFENIVMEGVKIGSVVEIESIEMRGYEKEYALILDDVGVNVEKIWHEDNEWHKAGYFDSEGTICYLSSSCDSSILDHIDSESIFEFCYTDQSEINLAISDSEEKKTEEIINQLKEQIDNFISELNKIRINS